MRKLEMEEILKAAEEYEAYETWSEAIRLGKDLFGESLYKIEFELEGQYNDEGSTSYNIDSITATDADGEELFHDYSTPYWRETIKEWKGDAYTGEETDEEIDEGIEKDDGYSISYWFIEHLNENLPYDSSDPYCLEDGFIADKPPKLTYPEIYVPD